MSSSCRHPFSGSTCPCAMCISQSTDKYVQAELSIILDMVVHTSSYCSECPRVGGGGGGGGGGGVFCILFIIYITLPYYNNNFVILIQTMQNIDQSWGQ